MGDPGKSTELSESEQEAFSDKRSEALAAFGEGEWQKAIDLVRRTRKSSSNMTRDSFETFFYISEL